MIILVTGGAGSGKSDIGEKILCDINKGRKVYIATMFPYDDECRKKIKKHKLSRADKNFDTIEEYINISKINLNEYNSAIVECISNLVSNNMFMNKSGVKFNFAAEKIFKDICFIKDKINNILFVSNEVFSDGNIYSIETNEYIIQMAKINKYIAEISDIVIESVCGIPVFIKGKDYYDKFI